MQASKSFIAFKSRTQEIFDFAVLVTTSVPVLKHNIQLFSSNKISRIADPDYFEPSVFYTITSDTIKKLEEEGVDQSKISALAVIQGIDFNNREFKERIIDILGEATYKRYRNDIKKQSPRYIDNISNCTENYQSKLATYLYFSTFSYFEAYIGDVVLEIADSFNKVEAQEYIRNHSICRDLVGDRLKLNKSFDPKKKDRYAKISKRLLSKGYREPKELFFSSMLELLKNKVKDIKASEIPDFLERYFLYSLSQDEISTFGTIRGNRNSIGHGTRAFVPSLKDVVETNKFFRLLSSNIDRHLVFHFFSLQNFVEI